MHALRIIQALLDQGCASMHAKRRNCLARVAAAAQEAGLGVVRLGDKLASQSALRHRIKCCDRLLSNKHLANERIAVYRAMAARVLARRRQVLVVVDWSELRDDGSMQLLRAAVQVQGRAVVVYEEVHARELLGSLKVHRRFMLTLRSILPPHSAAIIMTDAGFRATWFKMLSALGFSWIGRIRNRDKVCAAGSLVWEGCKTLYAKAGVQARDLGRFRYTRSNPTPCRLVLAKRRPKGRHDQTKSGKRALNSQSKKHSASQREPWLLACSQSLASLRADQVINLYAGRMQIEQTFRDLKNPQWGMGLRNSQTRKAHRLASLLLIGALLTYALWLIGLAARKVGFDIRYGSKLKAPNTLSILSLAMRCLNSRQRPRILRSHIRDALKELASMVRTYEI